MSDPVSDLKQELLAAAERQQGHAAVRGGRGRLSGQFARTRLLLATATLVAAAAVALLFTAPWTSSRGFLERAQAALTPPAGTVLHYKWVATSTSTDPACTATHGPDEFWIDQTPPHRYRGLLNDFPDPDADPRTLVCSTGTAAEVGGTLEVPEQTLVFESPNTLRDSPVKFLIPPDPVAALRQAISDGSAHHEGKAELHGRTVERIRIDLPTSCPGDPDCPPEPSYAYVDPATLYPVEVQSPAAISPRDGPLIWHHVVVRYLTYEYLARTDANLALTDIRAQHPNATGP
jgi:hypothetical protein